MFDWMGTQLDHIISTYVLDVVTTLIGRLVPLALVSTTVWVLLFGWAVLRNEINETVPTFVWKVFKMVLVLAFALETGIYISNVSEGADSLAMGVANTFLPVGVDPATVSTPYALLDKFNDDANAQVADIMKEASMFRLDLFLAAALFSLGTIAFLCVALFVVTLSKLLLTFIIAIGPLFILCLAWRPTQRFFDSWLSMLLNAVVLTWFAFFALGLSAFMGNQVFVAIQSGGGFLGNTFNVLGEAMRYCVLMILMAIICFQAPSLASALTGGAVVHQGIQMIQNAMMVSGLRSASASRNVGASGTAGGVVRAGTGLPYAAGRATGVAAAAGARFAGTMATGATAMAREGYGAARVAAYKLATLRARERGQ